VLKNTVQFALVLGLAYGCPTRGLSQEEAGVEPELLFPEQQLPVEPAPTPGESTPLPPSPPAPSMRTAAQRSESETLQAEPPRLEESSESASPIAALQPLTPLPAALPTRSVIGGDTALTRVIDRSAGAIAPAAQTPAFRINPAGAPPPPRISGLRVGPVLLRPSISFGIFGEKDTGAGQVNRPGWQPVFRISPSLSGTIGHPSLGRFIAFDYAASLQAGGQQSQEGALDQAFSLEGHYAFSKLRLQLGADYSFSSGIDRDVGASSDRTLSGLSLSAAYVMSVKSELQGDISATSTTYSGGISSEQLQASLFFDRQMSVKTRLGLGATAGALHVDAGEDQTFQQVHLRGSYLPTPKLSLSGSLGVEFRQTGGESTVSPLVSASASYQVRQTTTLQLTAARSVNNSALQQDTNYTSTILTLAVSQRFGERVRSSLAMGYQGASYEGVGGRAGDAEDRLEEGRLEEGRQDHYFFVRPNVTWQMTEHLSLSFFYSFGENYSSARPFRTQQVGLNGTLAF
jgi:hypothetical protein